MRKVDNPNRRNGDHWQQQLFGAGTQTWHFKISVGLESELKPAADEEEQRHMYLADEFEQSGAVKVADAESNHVAHNHHKDGYAL